MMDARYAPVQMHPDAGIRTFDAPDLDHLFTETGYQNAYIAERHAHAMGLEARVVTPAGAGTRSLEIDDTSYADLDALLMGGRSDLRAGIVNDLAGLVRQHDVLVDQVDLALVEALGLDLQACLHYALTFHDLDAGSCDPPRLVAADGSAELWLSVVRQNDGDLHLDATCATLAPGCRWHRGTLLVEGLPETLVPALAGRPLADLVRHPVIDPLDLTIMGVVDADGHHVVLTSHGPLRGRLSAVATLLRMGLPTTDAFVYR